MLMPRPWLKAKTTERLLKNVEISILMGHKEFGGMLLNELDSRSRKMTAEEKAKFRQLRVQVRSMKDR